MHGPRNIRLSFLVGQNVCAVIILCVMLRRHVVLVMGRNKKNVSEEIASSFRSDCAWRCRHTCLLFREMQLTYTAWGESLATRDCYRVGGCGGHIEPVKLRINA